MYFDYDPVLLVKIGFLIKTLLNLPVNVDTKIHIIQHEVYKKKINVLLNPILLKEFSEETIVVELDKCLYLEGSTWYIGFDRKYNILVLQKDPAIIKVNKED
jgi:hypothetical protein